MKKIKVIYIISYIDKAIAFEWIADKIDKSKFDLSFILLNNSESYLANYLKLKNIPVHQFFYGGKKDIPKVSWLVLKILLRLKPDVVHTHLLDADLIGLSMAKLAGIKKRIYTRHNSNFHKKYHKSAEKFDRINNFLCTHVASISKNISDILIREENVSEEKIRLIYHGFDLERFENVSPEELNPLLVKYNPMRKRPVVGVISRYMHWKGIHYIIPAFKKLLQKYPDAYLILANAGKGDYKEDIEKMLEDLPKDNYCEIVFENNLFALYHLFDVFVHTPIDKEVEAFGQIYVEALAAGIPTIVTKSGISREFIHDKKNALVVDFKNHNQIYDAMLKILSDKKLTERIIKNGKKSVQEMFSLKRMISTLEKLYLE